MNNLIFLMMGMFTVGCSSFMIAGLLPQIGQSIDQSIAVTGQGITAFSLTYLIAAPLFSIICVKKSVKRIIQFALIVFILGNLMTLFADNLMLYLLGRAVTGIGAGIFTPLCITIAVQCVSPASKGRVLSFVWGASSAGVVFGVPLGLYLCSLFNWQSSLLYVVILALIALIGLSRQKLAMNVPRPSSYLDVFKFFVDKKIMSVMAITCLTSLASLGLYSYVALIQSGASFSLSLTLFFWGLGGFIGSVMVGFFIDKTQNPQGIMAFIIAGLMWALCLIPLTKNLSYLGLVPFFLWGAFGWATTTPQQHILFELQEAQGSILVAMNGAAIGLGGALGTSLAGLFITSGFRETQLPFLAVSLLLIVFVCQLLLNKHLNQECNL